MRLYTGRGIKKDNICYNWEILIFRRKPLTFTLSYLCLFNTQLCFAFPLLHSYLKNKDNIITWQKFVNRRGNTLLLSQSYYHHFGLRLGPSWTLFLPAWHSFLSPLLALCFPWRNKSSQAVWLGWLPVSGLIA